MTKQYSQTPGQGEIFLDHVGWFVPDMDAAAAQFETLGFPLTPFTVHMNEQPDGSRVPSGTANRCAMIRRGYLEVLTRVPDIESAITQQMDAGLARYTGLHLIAFTVSDTDATTARLREQGFSPDPPVALRRPMPLDDGGEGTAAFSVIRLPNDAMSEGRVQVLSQDTPDVVWQPSVTADANGASMLSGILICAEDPAEAAGRYERFTGKKRRVSGDGYRIALDRGEIAICNQEECVALILVSKYRIFRLSPPYPSSATISLERDPTWMRTVFRWSLMRPIASSSMRLRGWGRISSFMQRKWSRFRNRERCLGVWIRFAYLASRFFLCRAQNSDN